MRANDFRTPFTYVLCRIDCASCRIIFIGYLLRQKCIQRTLPDAFKCRSLCVPKIFVQHLSMRRVAFVIGYLRQKCVQRTYVGGCVDESLCPCPSAVTINPHSQQCMHSALHSIRQPAPETKNDIVLNLLA